MQQHSRKFENFYQFYLVPEGLTPVEGRLPNQINLNFQFPTAPFLGHEKSVPFHPPKGVNSRRSRDLKMIWTGFAISLKMKNYQIEKK